ncbi:transcriptional regulator LysR family (plasmid) [Caballeronia insecticola]|uniref:Transcriptional regulator LysR family n=2 Tax=Caballeronia insecticola TaxID=758793 RepID=R4WUJ9_9BURK|nr:transcriptional regulator LysR family [Caballeronia insecticola]
MHATQAAISSRISALELELGVKLFERGPRDITLTQDGTKALPYAEQIVQISRTMLESVGDRKKIGGILRLGAIEVVIHTWLLELLKRIREEYPSLTLELTSDTSANLSAQVSSGHLDAALLSTPVNGADVDNAMLGSFPMSWIGSPGLGISTQILTEAQLAAFQIVSFPRHSRPHAYITGLFSAAGENQVQINCFSSAAAISKLVVDGFGIAAVPTAFVQHEIENGQLHVLQVAHRIPTFPIVVSYRRSPDSFLPESIARLARAIMIDFSLQHGPAYALVPEGDSSASGNDISASL